MLDILCATLGRLPLGLEHVPGPHRLLTDGRKGWAAASNALLDEACAAGHDALFLDDDVEILPETFSNWARYKPHADVFGWRLKTRAGRAISFGHCLMPNGWLLPNFDSTRPAYVAHVTASVLYIKHAVLAAGLRFPDWPGLHSEDVAFTYDAWLKGFKVAYLPFDAIHDVAADGMGQTKTHEAQRQERLGENQRLLSQWVAAHGVLEAGAAQRLPLGLWRIEA
jgi:GT2 family glycosyltransferase